MSRNLGSILCAFCHGKVTCDGPPRPITAQDCGVYLFNEYKGMIVAEASCVDCLAKYLAWLDDKACSFHFWSHRTVQIDGHGQIVPSDLSHRASFNAEPAEEDLPRYVIETVRLRKCRWPTCMACGKRIHSLYGCQCKPPEPAPDGGAKKPEGQSP